MFTGIVDHCGRIQEIAKEGVGIRLRVGSEFSDLALGESIAVDGVCLTVTKISTGAFECELSPETLEKTTAFDYHSGARVNLERALRLSDRLGGHIVTGHVDGLVKLLARERVGEFCRMEFGPVPKSMLGLVIDKGSIALNGVSLTVNKVFEDKIEAMLIPHTLERTNLGELETGRALNVEYDWLSKMVARQMETKE